MVHGEPGWDEATPAGPFQLYDVRPGSVVRELRDPLDLRHSRAAPPWTSPVATPPHNAAGLRAVFEAATSDRTATRWC